jgi:hypothetical protein
MLLGVVVGDGVAAGVAELRPSQQPDLPIFAPQESLGTHRAIQYTQLMNGFTPM